MEQMWQCEEATVRQVLDALNAGPKPRAYTTVMTTMRRLYRKGLLARDRRGKTDVYRASMSRAEFQHARARAEVDWLVDEYGEAALAHFAAEIASLDPERLRRLRELTRE